MITSKVDSARCGRRPGLRRWKLSPQHNPKCACVCEILLLCEEGGCTCSQNVLSTALTPSTRAAPMHYRSAREARTLAPQRHTRRAAARRDGQRRPECCESGARVRHFPSLTIGENCSVRDEAPYYTCSRVKEGNDKGKRGTMPGTPKPQKWVPQDP
eukprot:459236-Pleurochrysis_carterae.AAC.2